MSTKCCSYSLQARSESKTKEAREKKTVKKKQKKETPRQNLPGPGFEPGLLRPQRSVLTTRRSRLNETRRPNIYYKY